MSLDQTFIVTAFGAALFLILLLALDTFYRLLVARKTLRHDELSTLHSDALDSDTLQSDSIRHENPLGKENPPTNATTASQSTIHEPQPVTGVGVATQQIVTNNHRH